MSKKRHREKRSGGTAPTKRVRWVVVGVLALGIAGAILMLRSPSSPTSPSAAGTAAAPTAPTAASQPVQIGPGQLIGRWLRPDGGYVLEIRSAAADGRLDAGYFNPGPINVARAETSWENGKLKAFVELRDVNYPGSTYTLYYQTAPERLTGFYYQAALGQTFEVEFVRQP